MQCGTCCFIDTKNVILINTNFLEKAMHSVGCSICSIAAGFRNTGIKSQVRINRDLELSRSRDIIGHATIQFPTSVISVVKYFLVSVSFQFLQIFSFDFEFLVFFSFRFS